MLEAYFLIAEAGTRTRYEWTRLLTYTEWWQKPLLVLVCLLVAAYVVYMYRRDSVELKRGVGVLLAMLRLAAFGGLLLNYLDLQKRTDILNVQNSQVAVMIDVSTSMAQPATEAVLSGSVPSRIDQVTDAMTKTDLIRRLRQKHDITFYRFDEQLVRIATFAKLEPSADEKQANQPTQVAVGVGGSDLTGSDLTGSDLTGSDAKTKDENATKDSSAGAPASDGSTVKPIDWKTVLVAKGTESRYGQNLRQLVNDLRNMPLAGLVIVGDFAQNAGIDVNAAVQLASEAQIPVHTIGLGSDRAAVNAAIVDFKVPARAYPGDKFQIEALVQGKELAGRNVTVELVSRLGSEQGNNAQETLDAREVVLLGDNRDIRPLKFELPGIKEPGRRTYTLRLKGISQDSNPTDDQISADLEIVERKNTVLLFSGGPTREYQFLRNQLKRDKDTVVDVYLQNAPEGISQDARAVLSSFPTTMKDLAEYDTIVAFDPDWRELSSEQIQLLDDWLFKESGGLVVIAGPIYMEQWIQSKELAKIRSIYPVEFHTRLLALDDSKFGSTVPWPIEFSREGLNAEFLWLGSSAEESLRNWSEFPGVYGFYQVKGAKPGAVVYGRYSDPEAGLSDGKPVFLAEQFWGSGRVFYIGSGEFWRLREQSVGFVEELYTKLIRHVSQGRLLRGSRSGNMLLERDHYTLGSTVVVRAQLNDAQHEPLAVPEVTVQVARPDFSTIPLKLTADKSRPGMYSGQFPVLLPGSYQLELLVPESTEPPLVKRIVVTAPQLEIEEPQRRDEIARRISEGTGGHYYIGMEAALGEGGGESVIALLDKREQTRTTYESESRDRQWDETWMRSILFFVCGCLCLEWLIRRVCRLS